MSNSRPPSKHGTKEFLAAGSTGAVYALDDSTVVKEFYETDDMCKEEQILKHIGPHPNVVTMLGRKGDTCLMMERGRCLRLVLKTTNTSQIPRKTRLQWIEDAAVGMMHMHQQQVVHADIGCHNMIMVGDRVKYIDFEGCSLPGIPATAAYEWFSSPVESTSVSVRTDIFAFGCAAYEIMTGKVPHADLEDHPNRLELALERYKCGQWPTIEDPCIREIVYRCWAWQYTSAAEILTQLRSRH